MSSDSRSFQSIMYAAKTALLVAGMLTMAASASEPVNKWDVPDFYFSGISTFAHLPHEKWYVARSRAHTHAVW